MKELDVQIITYAPSVFYHCQHCEITFSEVGLGDRIHREQARDALPEDMRRDYEDLSNQVHDLITRYGDDVRVRVIDAASIEGVFKSIRFRAHRYPAVIVGGRRRTEPQTLTEIVADVMADSRNEESDRDGRSASRRAG